ncbi:Hypothetical protein PHPALM_38037, partial [Phytophthora palmivora]
MLVAVDALFIGTFNVSLTATSRELYFTNESNVTTATAVISGHVGWVSEPTVHYGRPVDIWFEGQENTAVVIPLDSVRKSLLADDLWTDTGDMKYGGSFGSLAFAKNEPFDFGASENVSVVPGQGYNGGITIAMSLDAYSPALNRVYILSVNLRLSVVPVAAPRFFSSALKGSELIYVGFNRELNVVVSESIGSSVFYRSDTDIVSFLVDVHGDADAVVTMQDPPFWRYGLPTMNDAPWTVNGIFVLDEGMASMNSTVSVLPPRNFVGRLPLTMQCMAVTSNLIPSELVSSEAVSYAGGEEHGWLTVLSTSIVGVLLPTEWKHAQAPRFDMVNTNSTVYEDELGVLWISELAVTELDATAPDVNVSLEVLLPQSSNLSVSVNGSTALVSDKETLNDTVYTVVYVPVDSKAVYISAANHSTHTEKPTLSVVMANTSISE